MRGVGFLRIGRHDWAVKPAVVLALLVVAVTNAGFIPSADPPAGSWRPDAMSWTTEQSTPVVLPVFPPDTDLLLAEPSSHIDVATLASVLTRLGYAILPGGDSVGVVRVRVPVGTDAAATARRLADTGLLASVEPDVRVHANRLPDDPRLPEQLLYLDAIYAPAAWDVVTSAAQVTIAVVDTGIDVTHPDLTGHLLINPAATGTGCPGDLLGCTFASPAAADPSCGYTQAAPHGGTTDDEGHGTFIAAVAAAAGNNGIGIAGIAWNARLLPVKVLDCTATGRISEAAAGVLYAARMGARVIIVAFGSSSDSRVLREAVVEATDRYGALVVASVGNEGTGRVQFPAAYPGVLAVGGSGVRRDDGTIDYLQRAPFSNFGPELSLFAPAVQLLSPVPPTLCGRRDWICTDGAYARASGTSFAAPLAAGAAALLIARDATVRPAALAALLNGSAQTFASGFAGPPGLLDVAGGLARAASGAGQIISGSIPRTGGFGLIVFGGGTVAELVAATGCPIATMALWVTVGGDFVGYVPGTTIGAVNADFLAAFPGGQVPANTALIGKCA